jgi:aspartate-semialdehyde dehydrogenase
MQIPGDGWIKVGVVGATGVTGQQFLAALADHPTMRVTHVSASARSAGKRYIEAIRDESGALAWYADGGLPSDTANLIVEDAERFDAGQVDLVFSCIDATPARELEPRYAEKTPVLSTASAFRRENDVPLVLPGANVDHCALLDKQRSRRGWRGFILPNPNCTTVGLAMTLYPLHRRFGVERVHMVSLQAVSGAGRSPGVIALDSIDNVLPYIPKEEDKVEWETRKILGELDGDGVRLAEIPISCTCTRIGVLEGHTLVVHAELCSAASADDIAAAWREAGREFLSAGYPSAPEELVHLHPDPFRPQVRLDRDRGGGLTTTVGRLRPDPGVRDGWKYVLVSHNTKMGAAKGCILLAEHLAALGMIGRRSAG